MTSSTVPVPVRADVWSDYTCPWCSVGIWRLSAAIAQTQIPVRITWRAFQIHPQAHGEPLAHRPAANYRQVAEAAAEYGQEFAWEKAIDAPTLTAHRLGKLADAHGQGTRWHILASRAFFSEGRDLADARVLSGLAKLVGLDPGETARVLATDAYLHEVLEDLALAAQIHVPAVPYVQFNGGKGVHGDMTVDALAAALRAAAVG